jgi:hypothetical protein
VGAVLTAQNFGMSGLAVSIADPGHVEGVAVDELGEGPDGRGSSSPLPTHDRATYDPVWHWATAAELAVEVLDRHLATAPARSALNLNVPNRPRHEVTELRWAHLAPFGAVRAALADVIDGRLQFELRVTGYVPEPDTDTGIVESGAASLTTLVGVVEAWTPEGEYDPEALDVTDAIVPGAPVRPVHRVPDASVRASLHRPAPPAERG